MKLQQIYKKDINRHVNPAVYMMNFDEETIKTEIEEYVFTDEIIKGLYQIMAAIRDKNLSQTGIWVSGYYGSGKSHFLKYLNYCFDPKHRQQALARLEEAVKERDPLMHSDSKSGVMPSEMADLSSWINNAEIDTIPFNLGTVQDGNDHTEHSFLGIFWKEFNRFRGYNNFNLALAQFLEQVLDQHGKYDDFKAEMLELGFEWPKDAETLIVSEQDMVLETAKNLVPSLSIESIGKKIDNDEVKLSVENFANTISSYLQTKGDNYRLLFLADEASLFINNSHSLLLQLQSVVEDVAKGTDKKVWFACSAQQDLSEILDNCHIQQTNATYGQIMGRFNVKISLKGTKPELITQKRILEKDADAAVTLGSLYDSKRTAISQQFNLPNGYRSFESREDFVDYYPFVPYQFTLITKIFDAFMKKDYVEKEVKGNQRSIIKVTHATAQATADDEIGHFIAFDQLFNNMFEGALTAMGQRAIEMANNVIANYSDPHFGQRVVNVLFMISNMSDTDKAVFATTANNIAVLLMQDVDCQKQGLLDKVNDVLCYLKDNNIIQDVTDARTNVTTYKFYTSDEREVAGAIKEVQIDNNYMATQLEQILRTYTNISNRESYCTSSINVAASIMGKNLWTANNAPVQVEFVMDSDQTDPNLFCFQNPATKLVFFMAPLYSKNTQFINDFFWFCQVSKYINEHMGDSAERQQTIDLFRQKSRAILTNKIQPAIRDMFDKCDVIGGSNILSLGTEKGAQRYKEAIKAHLADVYKYATLVNGSEVAKDSQALRARIQAPKLADEYVLKTMSPAEEKVEEFLMRQPIPPTVKDVTEKFTAAPYGWNEICTLYLLNELVRRGKRSFNHKNSPAEKNVVAEKLAQNQKDFTICPAQAIDMALVQAFASAWADIFNEHNVNTADPDDLKQKCVERLEKLIEGLDEDARKIDGTTFVHVLDELKVIFHSWKQERDMAAFFKKVSDPASIQSTKELMDKRKQIRTFVDGPQLAAFKEYVKFINDNQDNWSFIPDFAESVANLKNLLTDEWPLSRIRDYKALKDKVQTALNNVKADLKQKIRQAYLDTDKQLHDFAQSLDVTYTGNVENAISTKMNLSNIHALNNATNTDAYYAEEAAKIQAEYNRTHQAQTPSNTSGQDSTQDNHTPKVTIKQVRISTRTTQTLKSSADVEAYVDKIRTQLMKHINDGDTIMVL